MIFDRMCKLIETHEPFKPMKKFLKRSSLFVFEGNAHEELPQNYSVEQHDWFVENFFLPFQFTCVEDKGSCMLLFDEQKNTKGLLHIRRWFVECLPNDAPAEAFTDGRKGDHRSNFPSNACSLSYGNYEYVSSKATPDEEGWSGWYMKGTVLMCGMATYDKILGLFTLKNTPKHAYEHLERSTLQNVGAATQEIMHFNSPDRFILKEEPVTVKQHKGKHKNKVLRSHERPIYTLLKPKEIRVKMGIDDSDEGRTSPRPHDRRAHVRTLRSEKFTHKQGKQIVIPATWVGPSENVVGNRRYKVLLDK